MASNIILKGLLINLVWHLVMGRRTIFWILMFIITILDYNGIFQLNRNMRTLIFWITSIK